MLPESHGFLSQQANEKKIAYIVGSFPGLTATFINREILEAQRQGLNLVLLSIRHPDPHQMSDEVKRLADETQYILPVPWLKFLAANLYFGFTQFWLYFSTLIYLLTRPQYTITGRMKNLFYFAEGIWASALLRPEHISHIHAHYADRATVVAMVVSRLLNVPYSFSAHAYDIYIAPALLPEKIAGAKFVATCTAYNKTHLERVAGQPTNGKIKLCYHGLELDRFPITPPPQTHKPVILSVGRLLEKKGFPYLFCACRHLRDWGYDFSCEIVGEGAQRSELEALIRTLGLTDTITLHGALPHAEVLAKFANATIFTLACMMAENEDRDGIPNAILEAMAMQVPVVSTRFSGIPEVIEDGVTGLLVSPKDDKALARALAKLLDDVDLRQKLGLAGRRFIERYFDIKTNVGQLVDIFLHA